MTTRKKVFLPGKGELTLTDSDHIATGGEGAVYIKKGLAIKLFLDAVKARHAGMEDKIQLLSAIKHPFIVAPQSPVYDGNQELCGYVMPVARGLPLIKTFANSWRDQNNFGMSESITLVENMREAVTAAHSLGALMVDGNEFNYLAEGTQPQLIDVDSWQVGRFKASALMPSIKDYHRADFSHDTDWFAWAIVSFQVFSGIHPYKGTHPDFKKGDLEARMRANASVFDPKVKLNSAVRDFQAIPGALRDWYEGVFQQGGRGLPPSARLSRAAPALTRKLRVAVTGAGTVRHDRVLGLGGEIRHVSGNGLAFYQEGPTWKAFDLQRKQSLSALSSSQIEALFANKAALVRHEAQFVFIEQVDTELVSRVLVGDNDPQPRDPGVGRLACVAEKFVVFGNRVFALNSQNENGMLELAIDTLGGKTLVSVKTAWPVLVQSTRFYDGCGVLDALGHPFIIVPQDSALIVQRAPALREYRVVTAFSRGPQLVLLHATSRLDGKLYRLQLRQGAGQFELLDRQVVDEPEWQGAVNQKGILAAIHEDGEITVTNTFGTGSKVVQDSSLSKTLNLFSLADGIYYYRDTDVFRLALS